MLLFACSSGGDGGSTTGSSTTSGVTYTGATTPAQITSTNADALAGSAVNGSSRGQTVAALGALSNGSEGIHALDLVNTILNQSALVSAGSSVAVGAVQAINQTINGADSGGSGTATITGQVDNVTGYGSITMTFNQLNDGAGTTINGSLTFAIDATGTTITFTSLSIQDATGITTLGGSIGVVETLGGTNGTTVVSDVVTINFAAKDANGNQIKLENFRIASTYDSVGLLLTESISGRFYDSAQGYIDITTTSPLVYSPAGATNPSSGGPLIAVGANNTKMRLTPIDPTNVLIEADTTGDGNYDYSVQKAWSAL